MSSVIETKISRISQAVSDALAAVAAKGVSVPEGAGVDALAGLIGAVEGGLPVGIAEMSCGEYVLASDTSSAITVEHGLSDRPHLFAYRNAFDFESSIYTLTGAQPICGISIGIPRIFQYNNGTVTSGTFVYYDGETGLIRVPYPAPNVTKAYLSQSDALTVPAGSTFKWIAVRFSV